MTRTTSSEQLPSSFRDPSGFLFKRDGTVYRQVNEVYQQTYNHLMSSGLYRTLVDESLLIPHEEVDIEPLRPDVAYKVIKPEQVPFISYPYEWCFSQLKDAALTTLRVQRKALDFGMSLKDCSAYNIQFVNGKPVFIDTLSFEMYREGRPWVAYRQFCQHFLTPLALMSYKDIRLGRLLGIYLDGVPLDLTSSLLPLYTWLKFPLLTHIHLHARSQKHYGGRRVDLSRYRLSRMAFLSVLDNLETALEKLEWQAGGTEWAEYYEDTNYSAIAFEHKKRLVAEYLTRIKPANVWDLGANIGVFSRIAADMGILTVSFDMDPAAVEKNYLDCKKRGERCILPLVLDLTNPSPGLGWAHTERASFLERGPADVVMALALIHHLAISNNVPLCKNAEFLSRCGRWLIIEFVPKDDSRAQRLLVSREDIFVDYTQEKFEKEFARYFTIEDRTRIKDSGRTVYLMRKLD